MNDGFRDWLLMKVGAIEAMEDGIPDPDYFGQGYDKGWCDAIRAVWEAFEGKDATGQ
jgi:hypothetical protein